MLGMASSSFTCNKASWGVPGFVEEMRFAAMWLLTRDQAPKEGQKEPSEQPAEQPMRQVQPLCY